MNEKYVFHRGTKDGLELLWVNYDAKHSRLLMVNGEWVYPKYPWLRPIAWYKKLCRVFKCVFSLFGEIAYLDYLLLDMEYLKQKLKEQLEHQWKYEKYEYVLKKG